MNGRNCRIKSVLSKGDRLPLGKKSGKKGIGAIWLLEHDWAVPECNGPEWSRSRFLDTEPRASRQRERTGKDRCLNKPKRSQCPQGCTTQKERGAPIGSRKGGKEGSITSKKKTLQGRLRSIIAEKAGGTFRLRVAFGKYKDGGGAL